MIGNKRRMHNDGHHLGENSSSKACIDHSIECPESISLIDGYD